MTNEMAEFMSERISDEDAVKLAKFMAAMADLSGSDGEIRQRIDNLRYNANKIYDVMYGQSKPDESKPSGGHVYDQAKTDEGWKPDQKGGVVTAEPDSVARAREAGEKQPVDSGGDMKQ